MQCHTYCPSELNLIIAPSVFEASASIVSVVPDMEEDPLQIAAKYKFPFLSRTRDVPRPLRSEPLLPNEVTHWQTPASSYLAINEVIPVAVTTLPLPKGTVPLFTIPDTYTLQASSVTRPYISSPLFTVPKRFAQRPSPSPFSLIITTSTEVPANVSEEPSAIGITISPSLV